MLPPLLALLDVPVEDAAWQALDPPDGDSELSMPSSGC
jgi:hypothetical protein